jgi:hypothetical protein
MNGRRYEKENQSVHRGIFLNGKRGSDTVFGRNPFDCSMYSNLSARLEAYSRAAFLE